MNKKDFEAFDDIRTPDIVKDKLYQKIERNGVYMKKRKIIYTCVSVAVIMIMVAIPLFKGTQFTDMSSYLKASEAEVKQPLEQVLEEKKTLTQQLEDKIIDFDTYQEHVKQLKAEKDRLLKKQEELNKQYEVSEKTIANSKQKKEIEGYLNKLKEIEKIEDELDKAEDQLEKDYKNGLMSQQEFIDKKTQLDKQDEVYDLLEDEVEAKLGDQDLEDKDDINDYDDEDDDEDDHDDLDDDHDEVEDDD